MSKPYFVRPTTGYFDVVETSTGRVVVNQEGYTIAHGTAWHLNCPDAWSGSEACELADAIRSAQPSEQTI
jgi:hypothetical protein